MTLATQGNILSKVRALFLLTRPINLLIIGLTQYVVAICLVFSHFNFQVFKDSGFFIMALSTIIIAASGYIINDYYDVKIDFVNKPDKVVVGRMLSRRMAMVLHTFLNFLGIGLAFSLSWKLGIIAIFASVGLWFYSNELKRRPFLGNFSVAVITGLSVLEVSVFYGRGYAIVALYALFALGLTLIREIVKDLEDKRGDEAHGCKTLPIIWGQRRTVQFTILLVISFALMMLLFVQRLQNLTLLIYFACLLIPLAYLVFRLSRADTTKHFTNISALCKWIMLLGVASMFMLKL